MKYYSFDLAVNYADEFDLLTLFIVTEKGLERIKKILSDAVEKNYENKAIFFGSNENIYVYDLIDNCSGTDWYHEVNENDINSIFKVFGYNKTFDDKSICTDGTIFKYGTLESVFDQLEDIIKYVDGN